MYYERTLIDISSQFYTEIFYCTCFWHFLTTFGIGILKVTELYHFVDCNEWLTKMGLEIY